MEVDDDDNVVDVAIVYIVVKGVVDVVVVGVVLITEWLGKKRKLAHKNRNKPERILGLFDGGGCEGANDGRSRISAQRVFENTSEFGISVRDEIRRFPRVGGILRQYLDDAGQDRQRLVNVHAFAECPGLGAGFAWKET